MQHGRLAGSAPEPVVPRRQQSKHDHCFTPMPPSNLHAAITSARQAESTSNCCGRWTFAYCTHARLIAKRCSPGILAP